MSYRTGGVSPGLLRAALAEGLGIGEPQARVLVVLLQHQEEGLSTQRLQYLIDPHKPVKRNVLQERVRSLRIAMGRDSIGGYLTAAERVRLPSYNGRFQDGEYSITPEGIERCQVALDRVADALRLREAGERLRSRQAVGS